MITTSKKIINVVIFIIAFHIANIFAGIIVGTIIMLFTGNITSANLDTYLFTQVSMFFISLIGVAITFGLYHFIHFKTLQHLPGTERENHKSKYAKIIWVFILLGSFLIFFIGFKLSGLLYDVAGCSGGVDSGISCSMTSMTPLVELTQFYYFIAAILGIPVLWFYFLFFGLYVLARYSRKKAIIFVIILAIVWGSLEFLTSQVRQSNSTNAIRVESILKLV